MKGRATMTEKIDQFVQDLSWMEKVELLRRLKLAIAEERLPEPGEPDVCPRCGCPIFVKKGHDKDGKQRWLCKGCGQTFCASTLSLLGNSKLDAAVWYEYATCMVDGLSLRDAAQRCSVSLPTSWFMRHRLCEVMAKRLGEFRSGPSRRCQVDETSVNESLKGNWARSNTYRMPRKKHRCGRDGGKDRRKMDKVQIICGVNDLGDCFCDLAARAQITHESVMRVLGSRIEAGSIVDTDDNACYRKPLAVLGVRQHMAHSASTGHCTEINRVNALHHRLHDFLRPFHGVATRRIQHYLDWFCFIEQSRRSEEDKREIVFRAGAEGTYDTVRREYSKTSIPFQDYWGVSILA